MVFNQISFMAYPNSVLRAIYIICLNKKNHGKNEFYNIFTEKHNTMSN